MSEVVKSLIGNQYLVKYSVGHTQAGIRLDRFLMARYRKRSREQLKKAIDSGAITISREGGKHLSLGKIKPSIALQQGDVVHVVSRRAKEPEVNFDYKVLFEDDAILVINKPPNLPVHPAGRFFFNTLIVHLKTKGYTNESESTNDFYLVHRIDKETSGVLLLAKTKEACNTLTAQFRNRETDKYYLAIARGIPTKDQFDVDASIGKNPESPIGLKMYSRPEAMGGLTALTHFEKIETREDYTLLACFPRTGRQHQIRVHADIAGLPLVGDKLYGMSEKDCLVMLDHHRDLRLEEMSEEVNEDSSDEGSEDLELVEEGEDTADKPVNLRYQQIVNSLIIPRHALHAAGLRFKHPTTGKEMVFESRLPDDLREFFERLTDQPLAQFKTKHW